MLLGARDPAEPHQPLHAGSRKPDHPGRDRGARLGHSRRDVRPEAADRLALDHEALEHADGPWRRRRRPRTASTSNASAIDVRLFTGKRFGWFEFAAGAGADLLSGKGEVAYRDPGTGTVGDVLEPKLSGMRIITALNLGVHVGPLHLVGEGGYQVGSNLALTTRYAENNPNAGKFFGGLGVVLAR